METRVTNNSSITNYENAFHTLGLDHMIHMLEPIRTAYTHDKEYLIVREHKKLDAFLAKQEKSIYIRTGEWCGVTQITPPKTADKKIKIEQNKEQYIDREMSYKKYYKTIMIPSASVIEVCKKVNRNIGIKRQVDLLKTISVK